MDRTRRVYSYLLFSDPKQSEGRVPPGSVNASRLYKMIRNRALVGDRVLSMDTS